MTAACAFSFYASKYYLATKGLPTQGNGLTDFDLITIAGPPTATTAFFMGEALEDASIALRCGNPSIELLAAASKGGVGEVACFGEP